MTLEQFLKLKRNELSAYANAYREARYRSEPGFGTEKTAEDWCGSFDAWQRLRAVATSIVSRKATD